MLTVTDLLFSAQKIQKSILSCLINNLLYWVTVRLASITKELERPFSNIVIYIANFEVPAVEDDNELCRGPEDSWIQNQYHSFSIKKKKKKAFFFIC